MWYPVCAQELALEEARDIWWLRFSLDAAGSVLAVGTNSGKVLFFDPHALQVGRERGGVGAGAGRGGLRACGWELKCPSARSACPPAKLFWGRWIRPAILRYTVLYGSTNGATISIAAPLPSRSAVQAGGTVATHRAQARLPGPPDGGLGRRLHRDCGA